MDPPPPAKAGATAASVTAPSEKATKMKVARPTTLLDVQEVEWVTRELERLLAREQSGGGAGDDAGTDGRRHRRKRARLRLSPAARKGGGFLADLLGTHAVSICSGNAAMGHSSAAGGVGRRPCGRAGFREVEKV